jgi:hypothetical protein
MSRKMDHSAHSGLATSPARLRPMGILGRILPADLACLSRAGALCICSLAARNHLAVSCIQFGRFGMQPPGAHDREGSMRTGPEVGGPFEDFARARSGALFRTALLLTGQDRAEAEDLLQGALERAYRHWGRICRHGDRRQGPPPGFAGDPVLGRQPAQADHLPGRLLAARHPNPLAPPPVQTPRLPPQPGSSRREWCGRHLAAETATVTCRPHY